MAIGTAAAIGLGVAGIGSALGASSANKASRRAADTATQTAQMNNALARDIYGQNQQALSPFMQRGNAAGNQINALLGLGGAANNNTMQPSYGAANGYTPGDQHMGGGQFGQYVQSNPDLMAEYNRNRGQFGSMADYGRFHWQQYGQNEGRDLPSVTAQPAQGGQNAQQAATNAFDTFRNSTGYQFRLGEGMNALNSGWAGAGTLQSGAAAKDAMRYGQNFASNEFGNYMGALQGQQAVGLGGASALAGVGQNYAGLVTQNNNSAGSAVANSQLAKQNVFGNMAGMIGGGLFQYGLGG